MPRSPILAGEEALASRINNALDDVGRTVHQTTEPIRNNQTSYLDSTSLVLPVEANATYVLNSLIVYDSATAADIKIRFSLPAGGSARLAKWGQDVGATGVSGSINVSVSDDVADVVEFTYGGLGVGTMVSAKPSGLIIVGGTAGNVTVGFAQNTANASVTTLRLGSSMSLARAA
ncbi:MAG: hypothetical protein ACRDTG_28590 [Pseudonocardiaceae bacterium]